MTQMGDIWRQAAGKWTEVSGQVGDDHWDQPVPTCDGWTVRDLVDHTMGWQATGGAMVGAGTEPGQGWSDIEPKLSSALDDPSNLEGNAEGMGGMPKQQAVGFLVGDLLVHSWDLARAIGADETLPEPACQATLMGLQRAPEEMLRGENMFGPKIDVGPDASMQEQMLAFTGRQP